MELEGRGGWAVVVTTPPFLPLTRRVAGGHSAVLTVPHPLGGVDPEVIREHARAAVDDLVAVITGTRAQRMTMASFDDLRATLRQDGGELTLLGLGRDGDGNGTVAQVALELLDAGCAECVMPRAFLEPLILRALAAEIDGLVRVELHDPRETPAP